MTINNSVGNFISDVTGNGQDNSALVLQDEEGSALTDLEGLCGGSSETSVLPSAIHIENSKDVIIGPVTQFHGPVNIYQNSTSLPNERSAIEENKKKGLNGKLVKSESVCSDVSNTAEKPTKNYLIHPKYWKYIAVPVIVVLIIMAIVCTILVSTNFGKATPTSDEEESQYTPQYSKPLVQNSSEPKKVLNVIKAGSMVTRDQWKAEPPIYIQQLEHPIPFVVICHTASRKCNTFVACSKKVKNIQDQGVTDGLPDLKYNFLIGGDAVLYVGRGWDARSFIDNSITIAFIGDYVRDRLTEDMITTAKNLIKTGVDTHKLSKNYTIICHNQTQPTLSPGTHVYEEIKTWPHFDPQSYVLN